MPRAIPALTIRDFGGMQTAPPGGKLAPQNAVEAYNVHTRYGAIRPRPLETAFATPGQPAAFEIMASCVLNATRYLACWSSAVEAGLFGRYRFLDQSGSVAATINGASAVAIKPQFVQAQNRLYAIAGDPAESKKFWYAAGIQSARIGIVAPTVVPALVGNAGGLAAGTYSYRYTYYNANAGVESGPSPETTIVIAVNSVDVTPTASADAQVTHIRIYRRLNQVDSTWFFVMQVANATALTNDNNVTIAKLEQDRLNVISTFPPSSTIAAWHRRYMFYAYSGSRVARSEFERPEQVNTANSWGVGEGDGEDIVGMVPAFGALFILKERSIWGLFGTSANTFEVRKLYSNCGAVSRDTILSLDSRPGGGVFFTSAEGPMYFDGQDVTAIGDPIFPSWLVFDSGSYSQHSATFDPLTNCYVVCGHIGSGWFQQLAFDVTRRNWFKWDMNARCVAMHANALYRDFRLMCAESTGSRRVMALGGFNPVPTEGVPWRWLTAPIDLGSRLKKRWNYIRLVGEPSVDAASVRLYPDLDSLSIGLGSLWLNLPPYSGLLRIGDRAEVCQFLLAGTTSGAFSIDTIELDAKPIGNR